MGSEDLFVVRKREERPIQLFFLFDLPDVLQGVVQVVRFSVDLVLLAGFDFVVPPCQHL